jgi:inner membrane protein
MIIGHLPAGYVISRGLYPRFESFKVSPKAFLWSGMVGAVAPDIDMFYFHLVDHRQHHHHAYATHYPIVWLALLGCAWLWLRLAKQKNLAALALIFALNGFAHMFLDTIVGDIWWLAPFVDRPFALFTVPALYKPWWLNFFFHWSFGLELAVIGGALYLWRWQPLPGKGPEGPKGPRGPKEGSVPAAAQVASSEEKGTA